MKPYYKSSASKKLRSRRIQSLLPYLKRSGLLPPLRSARQQAKQRLRLRRTMRCSKRSSTVNVKTLPFFVKRVFGLSQQPNAHVPSVSSTSLVGVIFRSRLVTMARYLAVGQRAKEAQSTCKTSSEVRSYAKQLWLPKAMNSSSVTSRKLSREYSRGLRITRTCLTSSALGVTLTPHLERRCLTYRGSPKTLIQTYANLQSRRFSGAAMVLAGLRLQHNYWSAFSVRHLNGMTKASLRSLASTPRISRSS